MSFIRRDTPALSLTSTGPPTASLL